MRAVWFGHGVEKGEVVSEVSLTEIQKVDLLGLSRRELEAFFAALGEKPFRARQLLRWLHQKQELSFGQMTDLSKPLRAKLTQLAEVEPPRPVADRLSQDGTRKWLFELRDGNRIETVFIPDRDRGTLCLSSQVGCALNCAFCATARQGFGRNLVAGEIIGQVWQAVRFLGRERLTNIVFMGMGEPLLNFEAVVSAVELLLDDLAYGFAKKRVTISTAGVVPKIRALAEVSDASLAVSLHATRDEVRDLLVPINRKYPIAELLRACRDFLRHPRQRDRKITWEYVMLEGINDTPEDARRLIKLLSSIPSKINLIPFNPFPGAPFKTSSPERIRRFQEILLGAGFLTTVRKTRGADIAAACGQLVGQVKAKRPPRPLRFEKRMAYP